MNLATMEKKCQIPIQIMCVYKFIAVTATAINVLQFNFSDF